MATILQLGQRVRCGLYWAGKGTIVAIYGEQVPHNVRSISGGVVQMGGEARFDVCFDNGSQTKQTPECIVRGVQWQILDEVATPNEIIAARKFCDEMKLGEQIEADNKAAAHAARVAYLRTASEYAHLERVAEGESGWCGKLAAKNLRKELRIAWPEVKFSVRKSYYGQVDVRWTGGPSTDDVRVISHRYISKDFDGMQDLQTSRRDPFTDVFGCGGYVSLSRERTPEERAAYEERERLRYAR